MNRHFLRTSLLALISFTMTVQVLNAQEAPVEPAPAATATMPAIQADVVYGHKMGMALTLDVVRPAEQNGAAVIFVVSGGWNSNWFPPESYRRVDLLNQLVEKGYVVIMLRHGSAPLFKVPDAVSDVKKAVEFLHKHCADYGFEENRIGVCGMSAGGHLSLMLGTDTNKAKGKDTENDAESDAVEANVSSQVAAVVAYFPPTDLRSMIGPSDDFPALDFDTKKGDSVSPIVHVTADDAPTLLVHGTRDRLVPIRHSQQIKTVFEEKQVPCELVTIEGAGHGFRGEAAEQATKASLEWFERYLNPVDK